MRYCLYSAAIHKVHTEQDRTRQDKIGCLIQDAGYKIKNIRQNKNLPIVSILSCIHRPIQIELEFIYFLELFPENEPLMLNMAENFMKNVYYLRLFQIYVLKQSGNKLFCQKKVLFGDKEVDFERLFRLFFFLNVIPNFNFNRTKQIEL